MNPDVTVIPQTLERISWAAILAGAVIALITQVGLGSALGSPDTVPATSVDTQQTSPDTVPPTNP